MYKISPTIDTKVCNKKVAVDDVYTVKASGRADTTDRTDGGGMSNYEWSCVDYVDSTELKTEGETKRNYGTVPKGQGLSVRFGNALGAEDRAEDGHGTCNEQETSTGSSRNKKRCGEEGHSVMALNGVASHTEYISNKWYTGKQTNRGRPGTAEGKINTAQGMAGDLVSNLNREEKSAVAGIRFPNVPS